MRPAGEGAYGSSTLGVRVTEHLGKPNHGFADAEERKLRTQLAILDQDVEIIIRPKAAYHAAGLVSVLVAA